MTQPRRRQTAAEEAREDRRRYERSRQRFQLVRAYVLMGIGICLVIYSFIPPIHPAALTLGGAVIGFNPLMQAVQESGSASPPPATHARH